MSERRAAVDHVVLLVGDLTASRRFYEAALAPLGFTPRFESVDGVGFGLAGSYDFGIYANERPSTRAHVAFIAPDRGTVDAFYAAALAAGGRDNGSPRIWSEYHAGYYGAFVLDPDENNIEAVYHDWELARAAGDF